MTKTNTDRQSSESWFGLGSRSWESRALCGECPLRYDKNPGHCFDCVVSAQNPRCVRTPGVCACVHVRVCLPPAPTPALMSGKKAKSTGVEIQCTGSPLECLCL